MDWQDSLMKIDLLNESQVLVTIDNILELVLPNTVPFHSIRKSRVTTTLLRSEIWCMSRVTEGFYELILDVTKWGKNLKKSRKFNKNSGHGR